MYFHHERSSINTLEKTRGDRASETRDVKTTTRESRAKDYLSFSTKT